MLHSNAQYVALRVVLYIWNKCLFRLRENQSYGPQEQFLRIRKFSVFLSFCVFRFLCVWQRECGRPSNASHGEARQWWVSVGQLWHILHFLNPHTRWLMCCALRKGEKNTSQEGWMRGPVNKTHRATNNDWHAQTMRPRSNPHPPERQCQGFTHTHTALTPALQTAHPLKDTHIH